MRHIVRLLPAAALLALALVMLHDSGVPAAATIAGQNGRVAFESHGGDNADVFVANGDGSGLVNVTNDPAEDLTPAWSPDGTKIVFASDREEQGLRKLYTMDPDGSNVQKLTDEGGSFWPSWSPDGSTIVYRSGGDIWRVNADGGSPAPIIQGIGTASAPDVSPDGAKIAYISNSDGDFEVYVADIDGSNVLQLTHNSDSDDEPGWSPDGARITFTRTVSGQSDIWVMDADGGGQTNISNNAAYDSGSDWSPDGTLIAFASERDPLGIYMMAPDGSDPQLLTAGDLYAPEWEAVPDALVQGDTDCDGDVDDADALALLAHSAGIPPAQEPGCPEIGSGVAALVATSAFGDVDCSGDAGPLDALGILFYLQELPVNHQHLPCTDVGSPLPDLDLPPP